MAVKETIYIGSDHYIVQPVFDEYSDAEIADATVSAQLKTTAGASIGSSVACAYQSDGIYLGTVPSSVTVGLTEGTDYHLWVTVSDTANDVRRVTCKARYREQT